MRSIGLLIGQTDGVPGTIQYNFVIANNIGASGGIIGKDQATSGNVDQNATIVTNSPGGAGINVSNTSAAVYAPNYYLTIPGRITAGNAFTSQVATNAVATVSAFESTRIRLYRPGILRRRCGSLRT